VLDQSLLNNMSASTVVPPAADAQPQAAVVAEEEDDLQIVRELEKDIRDNEKRRRTILAALFTGAILCLALIIYFSPKLSPNEREKLFRIPRGADDLRLINEVISHYAQNNFAYVLFGFVYLYIFLQSFAIPGPIFLSILSGALFGGVLGFTLVCICATTGASFCYGLSFTLARGIVVRNFPKQVASFHKRVQANKSSLFFYMLFLRFTPLVPNIVVNIASPLVGMPFKQFALGTLFGLMPLNIIHIRAGMTLNSLTQIGANVQNVLGIALLGVLALIPTIVKKRLEKIDQEKLKKQ
jgi:uncharacterized membrane protein YdjX (TVP38/TMEM64 family)